MMNRARSQNGFTLVELMFVIVIIGIVMGVTTYSMLDQLPKYRLRSAANNVAANIQYIKMRAVATNRTAWFTIDNVNKYYTGFVDEDADSVADNPGEYDTLNADFPETIGGVPCFTLPPGISFGWPADYSGTGPDSVSPGSDSDGFYVAGDANDNEVGFKPSGIPVVDLAVMGTPAENVVIYLKNVNEDGFAISIAVTGFVRVWQWTGTNWTAEWM